MNRYSLFFRILQFHLPIPENVLQPMRAPFTVHVMTNNFISFIKQEAGIDVFTSFRHLGIAPPHGFMKWS